MNCAKLVFKFYVIALLCVLLSLQSSSGQPESSPNKISAAQGSLDYEAILRCGPNSLFLFLTLLGHDVSLSHLSDVPISPTGASMLDLRNKARELGVYADIRHYELREVTRIPVPAIGQFYTSTASITRLHFEVLYKVDSEFLYVLNGTTGEKQLLRRSKLSEYWTGYCIIENNHRAVLSIQNVAVACLVPLDLAIFVHWSGLVRRRGSKQTTT